MNRVTNETDRQDVIGQARARGAQVADDASVYRVSEDFGGIYAVEDVTDFVFVENGGGLFVPDDRDEIIEALTAL